MSTGPEPNADLVAVACVVEASLPLASEWSRILIEYIIPLLKRLNELHPTHQFRLAFVTYGAADTRPSPLLSKRFFTNLPQVMKELREDPSKLGIGQINSGGVRGLSALEGLVAAIELFDILMTSTNFAVSHTQTQTPQKDNRSLVSHLLHIAASPPDSAQRPQCNNLQNLDSITWESIPTELKKRKINLSLISLREIAKFQDLQSSVAGFGAQSPWFNVRAPHVLALAGFPAVQKTKDHVSTTQSHNLSPNQDMKRQKVTADPVSKVSSGSPALSAARTPPNQRPQQPLPSQPSKHTTPAQPAISVKHPALTRPTQLTAGTSVPASVPSAPAPASGPRPSAPVLQALDPEVLDQVVAPTGHKFGQLMERLAGLDKEIAATETQMSNAQRTGQMTFLAGFQQERAKKAHLKEQIKMLLKQHYRKVLQAKESLNTQAGTAGPDHSSVSAVGISLTQNQAPSNALDPSSEHPASSVVEEHRSQIPDSQILAQFWQSRGGTMSAPSGNNLPAGPSQAQPHPSVTPEVAAQMQKPIDQEGFRPQSFGSSSQAPMSISQDTTINPNAVNHPHVPALNSTTWHGTLTWSFPQQNGPGQATKEVQIQVVGIVAQPTPSDIRTDTWPKNLALVTCKEPLKENTDLPTWLKRHQSRTRVVQFRPSPRAPEGPINEQMFHSLNKLMAERRLYAYAGWQLPSGKFSYNILIFSMGSTLAGAIFPDGLPDLPGNGNIPEPHERTGEAPKLPLPSGLNIPPMVMTRLQGLDPAQQKQVLVHFARAQQEQRLKHRQQQQQQAHMTLGQDLGALGIPMPAIQYNTAAANISEGSFGNATGTPQRPMSGGVYGTGTSGGSGTVNYEMLQSFMHRNADGSSSEGLNPS
ncbi:hypothetical protein PAXRUDRAFT_143360 [Paxillus rubicundulus Ve08.2h10]|uniref:Mediator complex subunit 25 n=1 Tax=Paxillus rubicundulus Ve08.2h10 TaxID=930991 RepID=A0A0D0DQ01_9AGAM|nr:hypothetical protein PAXRUDRAFT_143360 [Paxillus rubicundulus Ve08.2h10]